MKKSIEKLVYTTFLNTYLCPKNHYVILNHDKVGEGFISESNKKIVIEEIFYCNSCERIYKKSDLRKY